MEDGEKPKKGGNKDKDGSTYTEAAQADLERRLQSITDYLLNFDQAVKARSADPDNNDNDVEKAASENIDTASACEVLSADEIAASVTPTVDFGGAVGNMFRPAATDGLHTGHRARLRRAAYFDRKLDGFRDTELLELLLSFAVPRRDTNPLAHALIDKFGSVLGALRANADDLARVRGMTKNAARLLPVVGALTLRHETPVVVIRNHFEAVEFFGSVYTGGATRGTYAACIDFNGRLVGVELVSAGDEIISSRDVMNAMFRKNTRAVMLVRYGPDLFPDSYAVAAKIAVLREALEEIGVVLLDFIMFTDYGYYTLGRSMLDCEWQPKYVFVPIKGAMSAPALLDIFAEGGKLGLSFDIETGPTGVIAENAENITVDLFKCLHDDE